MTIPLIRARANPNQELYVRALSSIYRYGFRIYDPDFALAQEPDPYEKCRKDPVVAQAIDIRLHGVAGRRWRVMPGGREKEDRELAMIVEDAIGSIVGFAEARYEMAQAVIRARSYAYIQGHRQRVRLGEAPAAKWWVPLSLKDIDRRRFRYVPMNNLMDSAPDSFPDAYTERSSPVNRKPVKEPFDVIPNTWGGKNIRVQLQMFSVARNRWEKMLHPEYLLAMTYNDSEMRLGYGRGLMESIYYYLWAKTTLIKEGLQGVEKWARGLWTVKIDGLRDASTGKPNDAVRDAWLEVMQDFQSRHVGAFDSKDEIDIIEGGGTGNTIIMDFIRYLDDAIRAVILGSNLPFGGGKGPGSYARAKEEGDVHESLIQFDRDKLDEEITRSLIGLFLRLNRKNILALGLGDARSPYFSVVQERMEDPSQSANVLSIMSNIGMKVREDEAYRKLGFTPPTEEDRVLDLTPEQMGGEEEFVEGEEEGFEEGEEEGEEEGFEEGAEEEEDVEEALGKLDDLESEIQSLSDEADVFLRSYRHHFCREYNISLDTFDRITMAINPRTGIERGRPGGGPPGPPPRPGLRWNPTTKRWIRPKEAKKEREKASPDDEESDLGKLGKKIDDLDDKIKQAREDIESGKLSSSEVKKKKDEILRDIKNLRNDVRRQVLKSLGFEDLGGSEKASPLDDPDHPIHIKEVSPEFEAEKHGVSTEVLMEETKFAKENAKDLKDTLKTMQKEEAYPEQMDEVRSEINKQLSIEKNGRLLLAKRKGEAAATKERKAEEAAAKKQEEKEAKEAAREAAAAKKQEEKEAKEQEAKNKTWGDYQRKQDAAQERATRQKQTDVEVASQRKLDAWRAGDHDDHYSHLKRDGEEAQAYQKEWKGRSDTELSDHLEDLSRDIKVKERTHRSEKGHSTEEKLEHLKGLNEMQREQTLGEFEQTRRKRAARDELPEHPMETDAKAWEAAQAKRAKPPQDPEKVTEEDEAPGGAGGGESLETEPTDDDDAEGGAPETKDPSPSPTTPTGGQTLKPGEQPEVKEDEVSPAEAGEAAGEKAIQEEREKDSDFDKKVKEWQEGEDAKAEGTPSPTTRSSGQTLKPGEEPIQESHWEGASGEKKAELVEEAKATYAGASPERQVSIRDHFVKRQIDGDLTEAEAIRRSGIPRRSYRRYRDAEKDRLEAEAQPETKAEAQPAKKSAKKTAKGDNPAIRGARAYAKREDAREAREDEEREARNRSILGRKTTKKKK